MPATRLPVGFCPDCIGAPPSRLCEAVLRAPNAALHNADLYRRARYMLWTVAHGVQHHDELFRLWEDVEVLCDARGRVLYPNITAADVHKLVAGVRAFRKACITCAGTGWHPSITPCELCRGTGTGVDPAGEASWKSLYGDAPWFVPLNDLDPDDPELARIEVAPGTDGEPPHMLADVALHMYAALSCAGGCPRCAGTGWSTPEMPRWLAQRVTPIIGQGAEALPLVKAATFCIGGTTWAQYHEAGLIEAQTTARSVTGFWRVEPTPPMEVVAGRLRKADGRVLVIKRLPSSVPEWSETWALPGGKVEAGESRRDALTREWYEEMNLHVLPGYACWRLDVTPIGYPRRVYVTIYEVSCAATEPAPELDPNSGTELRWVHPGDLRPEECLPSTLKGLM